MQIEGHPCLKDPKSAGAVQALGGEMEGLPMLVPSGSACWDGLWWVIYGGWRTFCPQGIVGTTIGLELRGDLSQALVNQAP